MCINSHQAARKRSIGKMVQAHGLTMDEARAFVKGKCCALCGKTTDLAVDHDHMTGEIPWNLAEACRIGKGMLSSHRKEEYL